LLQPFNEVIKNTFRP